MLLHLVCRAKDKNKNKNIWAESEPKLVNLFCIHKYINFSLVYGLALIVNQKWKNKIYKLGKVIDRIQILQLATFMNKRQKETKIWIEKDGFKPSPRLDWKIAQTF